MVNPRLVREQPQPNRRVHPRRCVVWYRGARRHGWLAWSTKMERPGLGPVKEMHPTVPAIILDDWPLDPITPYDCNWVRVLTPASEVRGTNVIVTVDGMDRRMVRIERFQAHDQSLLLADWVRMADARGAVWDFAPDEEVMLAWSNFTVMPDRAPTPPMPEDPFKGMPGPGDDAQRGRW